MRLKNKVAIIAGVGKGMGAATALLFAKEGAHVALAARSKNQIDSVAARIRDAGGEALTIQADLTNEDDARRLADETVQAFGGLDIFASFPGGFFSFEKDVVSTESDFLTGVLDNHLNSVFYGVRASVAHMRARNGGAIITTAAAYKTRRDGNTAYGTAKAGVIGMTRNLARELHADNIRVNCVAPGLIRIPLRGGELEVPDTTLQRQGQPEDIAYAALYLASDEAPWVTGQVLAIDGGDEVHAGQPRP